MFAVQTFLKEITPAVYTVAYFWVPEATLVGDTSNVFQVSLESGEVLDEPKEKTEQVRERTPACTSLELDAVGHVTFVQRNSLT